jgi:HEAT repeat protein
MRKRIVIALLALIAVVIGVLALPGLFSKEPKYRGKSTEGWIKEYCRSANFDPFRNPDLRREAVKALKALGTNSIPMLLEKYYSTNVTSSSELKIIALLNKLPESWNFEPLTPASLIQERAGYAILEMEPAGELILPLVTNRLRTPDETERLRTISLLAGLKMGADQAIPVLGEILTGTNRSHRKSAMDCLSRYGDETQPAIPAFTKLLSSGETDKWLIHEACSMLARFSNNSAIAIPALKLRLATELDPLAQLEYAITICQIDAQRPEELQFIVNLAANKTNDFRWSAIGKLWMIGKNASTAAPVLVDAVKDEEVANWQLAANTLLWIGQTNLMESAVMEKLQNTNLSLRLSAAFFLLKRNPTNSPAISLVMDLLRNESSCGYVISRLQEIYPPPSLIDGAFQEIVTNQNHRFHREAVQASNLRKEEIQAREEMKARYGLKQ